MSLFGVRKNIKLLYYIRCYMIYVTPKWLLRLLRKHYLKEADNRADSEYIRQRVDYYCSLNEVRPLPDTTQPLRNHTYGKRKLNDIRNSVYFFDSYEFTRYFSDDYHWAIKGGDNNDVMPYPTIVKSRPIGYDGMDNGNDVVLNMDKVRHFMFIKDPVAFRDKKEIVLFRGDIWGKPHRQLFLKLFLGHPMFNIGDTTPRDVFPKEWHAEKLTIREHLDYKYIMCLEGTDVASNLKWVMSSNSVAIMPRPKFETWYMEGTLVPDYHYIEIKPDYSDLIERIEYFNNHPEEAEAIISHAHEYVSQFQDKHREKLIGIKVMEKYFRMTGQS